MLFFANLEPSFLVRIFDILCIHCIFHTAFDPPPRPPSLLHRRLRKVQMARIFSRKIQVGIRRRKEEGIRSERDLENGWNILKHDVFCSTSELANSPEHDEHDGFGKGVKWRQGNHSIEFEGTLWNTQKHPMFCSYRYLTVSHREFSCGSR